MIATVAKTLTGWGVAERFAKPAAVIALGLGLLALLGALAGIFGAIDWWDDRQAVNAATNSANAEFRGRQVTSERKAGEAKDGRDRTEAEGQRDLQEELNDASEAGDSGADAAWQRMWD